MKQIRGWSLAGAGIALVTGTLLHFVYDWAPSWLSSVLGAVNESTWEHLKLLFWPILLLSIIEYLAYGRKMKQFWPVKLLSLLLGMGTIIILFYTYSGVLGRNFLAADIATFVIGVCASYTFACKALHRPHKNHIPQIFAVLMLLLLIAAFVLFTTNPPQIGLFSDPVTGQYGIPLPA